MKIVFMGTPDFSVKALEAIVEAGHQVSLVVTQEDKPKGRGKQMSFTPVKEAAIKYGIEVFQPHRIKDEQSVEYLKKYEADVFVVVAYGQILSKEILDIPKFGCVNIHASLLPKYRGAAPIQWVIIDGEKESGVTTMLMDQGLDTGDMLDVTKVTLDSKETGGSLHDKLSIAGAKLIVETLEKIEKGTVTRTKQTGETCYAKILKKSLGLIDFNESAIKIERLIRGLNPWPSAYTKINGKTMKIWDADVIEKEYPGENGEIVDITKDAFFIKTAQGTLAVKELQMEGKKKMQTRDFLCGASFEKGTVLGS